MDVALTKMVCSVIFTLAIDHQRKPVWLIVINVQLINGVADRVLARDYDVMDTRLLHQFNR